MAHAAAFSILALTVGLALARPRVGPFRVTPAAAAVLGALLALATGLLAWGDVARTARILSQPILTIVSLMVMTLVADRAGVFRAVAWHVARAGGGDGRRLFRLLFIAGTVAGSLFTNDAAVLIFTPMVYRLVEDVKEESWGLAQKLPYYFAVLYVANLVAPLVIGNPINIIVAGWFGISFLEYAAWMFLPALASIGVTYLGLRLFFARAIPARYRVPQIRNLDLENRPLMGASAAALSVTLLGFCTEHATGVPGAFVAAACAGALLLGYLRFARSPLAPIARGVGWDVLVFVFGIFLVARGLANAGLTAALGHALAPAGSVPTLVESVRMGLTAGSCSSLLNNHPVAGIMTVVIRDLELSDSGARLMAFSALIGGDLGPKMLPIGSLAALMWFRILRNQGVRVSYALYVKLGVPVTLAAILLALLVLNLERALVIG